ncbi:MAG TPA: SseB family protein [Actinomycetaceae bacterium]|nr:SseB family protein [Actinomycetaceae bacterium]
MADSDAGAAARRREPSIPPEVAAPMPEATAPLAKKERAFRANPFSGDDGSQPPEFAAAKVVEPPERTPAVVRALVAGRVLVPVLPHPAPADPMNPHEDDSCAAPPSILMELPDGRHAMPAFTSIAAMTAWNESARPVPMYGSQAAQAAYEQGDGLMLLDPGDGAVIIPRPAVWALATGNEWVPAWSDQELGGVAAAALAGISGTLGVALVPGIKAEVAAVVLVEDGLDRHAVETAMNAAATALSTHPVLRERIDSLELVPTTRSGGR